MLIFLIVVAIFSMILARITNNYIYNSKQRQLAKEQNKITYYDIHGEERWIKNNQKVGENNLGQKYVLKTKEIVDDSKGNEYLDFLNSHLKEKKGCYKWRYYYLGKTILKREPFPYEKNTGRPYIIVRVGTFDYTQDYYAICYFLNNKLSDNIKKWGKDYNGNPIWLYKTKSIDYWKKLYNIETIKKLTYEEATQYWLDIYNEPLNKLEFYK